MTAQAEELNGIPRKWCVKTFPRGDRSSVEGGEVVQKLFAYITATSTQVGFYAWKSARESRPQFPRLPGRVSIAKQLVPFSRLQYD